MPAAGLLSGRLSWAGAWSLCFLRASRHPPTLLEWGATTRSEAGPAGILCLWKLLIVLLRMVWNRPDCICSLIQKVSINGIHLQINFLASGWVSNNGEPPCGACTARLQPVGAPAGLALWPVLTMTQPPGRPEQSLGEEEQAERGRLSQGELSEDVGFFQASSQQGCGPEPKGSLAPLGPCPGLLPRSLCLTCPRAQPYPCRYMRAHTATHTGHLTENTGTAHLPSHLEEQLPAHYASGLLPHQTDL